MKCATFPQFLKIVQCVFSITSILNIFTYFYIILYNYDIAQINSTSSYAYIHISIFFRENNRTFHLTLIRLNQDNYHHSPNRDETIVAYFDSIGEGLASIQKGIIWQWNTLKSSANICIKANQQAYRLASKSTKSVSTLGRALSTFVLANV